MGVMPNDEWYKDLFDGCKTKKDVEDKARSMVKSRDVEIREHEDNAVTVARGHVATIESLLFFLDESPVKRSMIISTNQMY